MHLHIPDRKASTHTSRAVIRWRQFRGRLQFLSSLSGSTTGMHSSSRTSTGVCQQQRWLRTKLLGRLRYLRAYTPSTLWRLSSSTVSSSTSWCPLGSERSAGCDPWTRCKVRAACTPSLKHIQTHVHFMWKTAQHSRHFGGLPYSCCTVPSNKQGTSSSEESDEWNSANAHDVLFLKNISFFIFLSAVCVYLWL